MNSFSTRQYKDESPLNTIHKIRSILTDLGIFTIETGWQNSADGFYSVNLNIENTNLYTNGKGSTSHYALASAYGELMERLQNQSLFRLNTDLNEKALNYKDFYYSPDEKHLDIEELINSKEDWIKNKMSKINSTIDQETLLNKWKAVSYEETPSDFVALPYLNTSNNELSYIPIKMISKMYMSNGMCGGNTREEALVQGLSEVFERYVNKEIIKKRITPPTIPKSYLEDFPKINTMIKQIESNGNYEVVVKDCSLNRGYPVVCVIYINKDDQTYFIKFGAHPIFEIAVERTLTELLQGQNIKSMKGVKEYAYKVDVKDEKSNLLGILVNGSGFYPPEIFNKVFSYEFNAFKTIEATSNKQMFHDLVQLLQQDGYDVFVRDVSFLGFPSFHVIVPDFSEIDEFDDCKAIDEYAEYNKIKKYVRHLDASSNEQIEEIMHFLSMSNYNSEASITQLLNIPIKDLFPWYYMKIDLFIAAVYCAKEDYEKAYEAINRFIETMNDNPYNKMEKTYYKCARDYIGTKMDALEEYPAITHLSVFYPLPVIQGIINDFGKPEQILTRYGQIQCFNCNECPLKEHCLYEQVEQVYMQLKTRYAENPIDQNNLKELFL